MGLVEKLDQQLEKEGNHRSIGATVERPQAIGGVFVVRGTEIHEDLMSPSGSPVRFMKKDGSPRLYVD